MKIRRVFSIKSMTIMAMLAAMAIVLMIFNFPLWFTPPFYKLDFSEVPVLIGAFSLGPVAGVIIELLKVLVNLVIDGTTTAAVGEFANFLIGCSMVVPASIMYHRNKTLKSAIKGLIVGTVFMVVFGSLINAFVLLPTYAHFFKMPISELIAMGTKVNLAIKDMKTFIFYGVAPFNLIKGVSASLITLLIYKRISGVIKSVLGR